MDDPKAGVEIVKRPSRVESLFLQPRRARYDCHQAERRPNPTPRRLITAVLQPFLVPNVHATARVRAGLSALHRSPCWGPFPAWVDGLAVPHGPCGAVV
jgi:hypothetical protein